MPPTRIAEQLNAALAGRQALARDAIMITAWIDRLFKVSSVRRTFEIRDFREFSKFRILHLQECFEIAVSDDRLQNEVAFAQLSMESIARRCKATNCRLPNACAAENASCAEASF
jgi:hypothetical protein